MDVVHDKATPHSRIWRFHNNMMPKHRISTVIVDGAHKFGVLIVQWAAADNGKILSRDKKGSKLVVSFNEE